jgi:hypothetical protein
MQTQECIRGMERVIKKIPLYKEEINLILCDRYMNIFYYIDINYVSYTQKTINEKYMYFFKFDVKMFVNINILTYPLVENFHFESDELPNQSEQVM